VQEYNALISHDSPLDITNILISIMLLTDAEILITLSAAAAAAAATLVIWY